MNISDRFDDASRIMASGIPRRQAVKLILAVLAGGSSWGVLWPRRAWADFQCVPPCRGALCCPANFVNGANRCCKDSELACCVLGTLGECCTARDAACCFRRIGEQLRPKCCEPPKNQCCNGNCCPPGGRADGTQCSGKKKDGPCCKPTQTMSLTSASGTQIEVTIQDTVQGIGSIAALTADNASISIPGFSIGATGPIVVTATKIDPSRTARVVLQACTPDICCLEGDPVLTTLKLTTGRWVRQIFTGIPPAEHFITIQNGSPGLKVVYVVINRSVFKVDDLGDGEETTLDVSAVMQAEDNTLILIGRGKPGASAVVVVSDSVDSEITIDESGRALGLHTADPHHPRHDHVWGNIVEHKEWTINQN